MDTWVAGRATDEWAVRSASGSAVSVVVAAGDVRATGETVERRLADDDFLEAVEPAYESYLRTDAAFETLGDGRRSLAAGRRSTPSGWVQPRDEADGSTPGSQASPIGRYR